MPTKSAWLHPLPRRVRGIPGPVPGADTVRVPHLGSAGAITRPVVAGVVCAIGIGAAIRLRAGQHVMRVWSIAHAIHHLALFIQCGLFKKIAAEAREFQRVAMQVGLPHRDLLSAGVVPRPLPDAVARADRRLAILGLRAQIGVPGVVARTSRGREHQAVRVRSRESAKVSAVADPDAGNEEGHGMLLRSALLLTVLRYCQKRNQQTDHQHEYSF